MPITHTYQAPNGASPTHHEVAKLEATAQGARAVVNSFLAAPIPGTKPRINWQDTHEVPPAAIAGPDIIGSVEAWLISPDGPFAGGSIVGTVTPAEELRAELIALAAKRRRELRKVYVHEGVPFDADEASAGNILAVLVSPALTGQEMDVADYKCADDVYRSFSYAEFKAMGLGMLAYVQDLHTRERELIDLVTTAADEALPDLLATVQTFTRPPEPEEEEEPAP